MNGHETNRFIERIKGELIDLPGEQAHRDMIPYRMTASEALKQPLNYRLSAVLLLLYFDNNQPHFFLTERQEYAGKHSGQISLPGGKAEDFDRDTSETALRETREEIGIPESKVEVLGRLTEVYVPVSQFLIHPYVGFIHERPLIQADAREVKTVLSCGLSELINKDNRILTRFQLPSGAWLKDIPAFKIQEKVVWGATAIILNEFKYILERIQ